MYEIRVSGLTLVSPMLYTPHPNGGPAGYFDAPGAPEAALMVATGQKDTFNNVVMVFCNIDG